LNFYASVVIILKAKSVLCFGSSTTENVSQNFQNSRYFEFFKLIVEFYASVPLKPKHKTHSTLVSCHPRPLSWFNLTKWHCRCAIKQSLQRRTYFRYSTPPLCTIYFLRFSSFLFCVHFYFAFLSVFLVCS